MDTHACTTARSRYLDAGTIRVRHCTPCSRLRHQMELSLSHWIVFGTTISIAVVSVLIHFEGLQALTAFAERRLLTARLRIAALFVGLLLLHIAEIWLFGAGYFFLLKNPALGSIVGLEPAQITDYVYYSAVVYTTLGFGDMIPVGHIRFLTGLEALQGLALITWSASFMFIEMRRYWDKD